MKSKKRVGCRGFRIQEAEVIRRPGSIPPPESPVGRVVDGIRQLRRHVAYNWTQTEHRVGVLLSRIRNDFESGVVKHLSQFVPPRPATRHVFAAISRKWSPPPATDVLTPHQAEIKRRVSHIPVYLVAKKNGKLIYIKPEHNEKMKKPIGLLFLASSGARQLLSKVCEDVPEFTNDVQVISLDLGSLYEMFSNKDQKHLKHVLFRFVPEPDQVKNAIEVMKQNGLKTRAFSGVPVFHVDGLNTGGQRLRPLFLNKEDLDTAVDSATRRKLNTDRSTLHDEADVLKEEAQEARLLAQQKEGKEAEKWTSIAARAEAKSRRISKRMQELPDSLSSRHSLFSSSLEILEDVLSEMERDKSGLFGSTMLIPSGLSKGELTEAPFTTIGERKIVNLQNRT